MQIYDEILEHQQSHAISRQHGITVCDFKFEVTSCDLKLPARLGPQKRRAWYLLIHQAN
jgi:hypothetical protein